MPPTDATTFIDTTPGGFEAGLVSVAALVAAGAPFTDSVGDVIVGGGLLGVEVAGGASFDSLLRDEN